MQTTVPPSTSSIARRRSEGVAVGFAGANAHRPIDRSDKNFAVADLPGLGRASDRLNDSIRPLRRDRDLDADLGQETHRIFGAAIDLRVPLLAAVTLDLGDGHSNHADRR